MTLEILKAGEVHVDEIAPLFDSYRQFYRQESDLALAQKFIRERLRLTESVIYLARWSTGEAIGFAQLYPTFSSRSAQRMWTLNDLFVVPDFRQKGVARTLVEAAKKHASETGAVGVILCTQHSNINAQRLYNSSGFSVIDEFKWYFASSEEIQIEG